MVTEAVVKKWGNSLGVILPKELIDFQHLRENDKVLVHVIKETDLSDIFGSLKGKVTMSGQQFKDMAREGWG